VFVELMHLGKQINFIFLLAKSVIAGTHRNWWQTQARSLLGLLVKKGLTTFSESLPPYLKQRNEYRKNSPRVVSEKGNSLVTNAGETSAASGCSRDRQCCCQGASLPSSLGHLQVAWQL